MPPYVILSDRSLVEMARLRPLDRQAFRQITGVGDVKLERYSDQFLEVIRSQGTGVALSRSTRHHGFPNLARQGRLVIFDRRG